MKHHNQERGYLLVAALLFSMTLAAFVTSLLSSGVAMRRQARYQTASQMAHYAAESGVHYAVAKLSGIERATFLAAGGHQGILQGSGERAPHYRVMVTQGLDIDGNDNDQDGEIDEPEEANMLELTSRGDYDGVARTVRVTLLARYETPTMPGATYFGDPAAKLGFNGNAFMISGFDVDLEDNKTGVVRPGIVVNGSPSGILSQITSQESDNVIGLGGTPSVAAATEELDLAALVEQGAQVADFTLDAGSTHKPSEEGEWGTLDAPKIIYAPNGAKISGGSEGAGILIVHGDLEISGEFEWRGLVIVQGRAIFKGGGGTKRLRGALVVEDEVFVDEAADPYTGMRAGGTVEIVLSEATVAKMTRAFAVYTVINWREGPNPPLEALP
jgi:hypothetical protein